MRIPSLTRSSFPAEARLVKSRTLIERAALERELVFDQSAIANEHREIAQTIPARSVFERTLHQRAIEGRPFEVRILSSATE
jgi:hypothetical protein